MHLYYTSLYCTNIYRTQCYYRYKVIVFECMFVGHAHEIEFYSTNDILISHDLCSLYDDDDIHRLFHIQGQLLVGPYAGEGCRRSNQKLIDSKPIQTINKQFQCAMELGYDGQKFVFQ